MGLVAVDDISFSRECLFDPDNSKLPNTSPTSVPPTPSASTAPINPCQASYSMRSSRLQESKVFHKASVNSLSLGLQDGEFFCQLSSGQVCIPATLQCDYHPDCPEGEDEAGCGESSMLHLQYLFRETGESLLPFC